MRPHHAQAGDVPVLYPIWRILLHLGQDVPDYTRVVIWRLLWSRYVDRNVRELRPAEGMVEVVFHEIANKWISSFSPRHSQNGEELYFSGRLVIFACCTCGISLGCNRRISISTALFMRSGSGGRSTRLAVVIITGEFQRRGFHWCASTRMAPWG